MRGTNVSYFWIFRRGSAGWVKVLDGPAHDLVVRRTSHHGLRDIQLVVMTTVAIHTANLRFNGLKYSLFDEKLEDIK